MWRDGAAMRSFMQSGVHRRVMARLPEWCDAAALVHWVQDDKNPPPWAEAHRRPQGEGRRSRVKFATEAHLRWPSVRLGLQLRQLGLAALKY